MSQYSDDYNICPMCGFEEGTLPTDSRCMEPGLVLADRYIVGMPLAIDGWLVRYIGYDALTNKKIVINEYHPARYAVREPGQAALKIVKQKQFYRYMSILLKKAGQLSETHVPDNVVNVCECFEKNNTAYVITEYSEGKGLADHIREKAPMRPEAAEKLMLPMLRSLDKLHDNGFISGGFSPASFIVTDENELILSDYLGNMFFNIADNDDSSRMGDNIKYFPPERYDDTDTVDITPENDVFSAAMIMYALLGAKLPEGNDRVNTYKKKHKDILRSPSSLKNDKTREYALINAAAVEPSQRTPDMETFIKELTGARKAELRSKQKKGGLPLWAKITIPAAAAAAVIGAAAAICIPMMLPKEEKEPETPVAETMTAGQTIVPSVLNYELSAAADELRKSGLILEIEGKEVNDEREENIIISQSVEKGSIVEENTVVGVKVNVRSGELTLPNFLGIDNKSCTDTLEAMGLNYAIAYQFNANISPGCVVSQSITPYTKVRAGQRIDIIVSQGPEPKPEQESSAEVSQGTVPVPSEDTPAEVRDYTGGTYESAVKPVSRNNLPVEVTERVYDDSKPEGTVIQQYPAAGESQKKEEPVKLVVTSANKNVLVPDVKMLNKDGAERLLNYCGLKAEFKEAESDDVSEGLIASQSPEAGKNAAPGDTVSLVISKGRKKVKMPDIKGKKLEDAYKAVKDAGLCGKVTYNTDKEKDDGIVLEQNIAAGTEITVGSEVLITVNAGSGTVEVPDIIGMTVEEADKKAEEAGLKLLIYVNDEHPYREGKVSAQGPHAGLRAEKGSDLVVLLIDDKAPQTSTEESEKEASGGADITITPESAEIAKGESFTLKIAVKGIDDLYKVEYDISDETVINAVHIDKETMDMTFIGLKPGTSEIKISCGSVVRICKVTVN